jgi:hypothetical protein
MARKEANRPLIGIIVAGISLVFGISGAAYAGGGHSKGPGPGGGGSEGGLVPVTITFAGATGDRIHSDNGTPYTDGVDGVEAFLGSKANYGNVFLRLAKSSRGLWLDFSDCVSSCNPPFTSEVNDLSSIKVNADDVQKDGLYGMSVGTTIQAPMRVYYQLDPADAPGFVDFQPNLTGSSPCRNQSLYVDVTRTGDQTWDVAGASIPMACVTLPDGSLGGVFLMPFEFTVVVVP